MRGRRGQDRRLAPGRWLSPVLLCLALFFPVGASAAQGDPAAMQRELDQAYERLLVDPSDRALNRRMIDLAVALDDYDAAIGAVERLIFYEPGNASLQLEAARFYFAIGSFAAARGYLDDVLKLQNIPPDVRRDVEVLIAKVDKAANPPVWGGFGQVGVRYQTNANIGPGFLDPNEEPFPVNGPSADWNAFALGTLGYANPINDHLVLEAQTSGYYAQQNEIHRLNLGFLDITAGPRFVAEGNKASLKPFALVQGILLGSDPYQLAYGGGVVARIGLGEGWWLEPQFEYKRREYENSDDYTDAETQTGNLYTYSVRMNADLTEDLNWSSRFGYSRNRAREDYQSFDYYNISTSVRMAFDLFGQENWALTPFASLSFSDYKGLAPTEQETLIDKIREDIQWSVGAILEIPWGEHFSFNVQVQYTENESNLSRYSYDNLQVILGPAGRF